MDYSDFKTKEQAKHGISGSRLILEVFNGSDKVIARGTNASWNDSQQNTPVPELGKNHVEEVVVGAMNPGQLQVQSLFTFEFEDGLPTYQNILSYRNMTAQIKVVEDYNDGTDDNPMPGKITNYFEGVHYQASSGQLAANGAYMRNVTLLYTKRFAPSEKNT